MEKKTRVAIAGVSGIGKHHAKWHHMAGAEVVAFLGSSDKTCATGAEGLKQIFPFTGRAYGDLDEMLQKEAPDIVDICLPNELHYDCAMRALEKGCHVLCEKPLVWPAGSDPNTVLTQARSMVELAQENGLRLGVCSQYAASLPHYARLYEEEQGPLNEVSHFYAEMDTLSRGRRRDAEEIWIDMGPHPLSLLLAWMPKGELDEASLQVAFSGGEARVSFDFVGENNTCTCEVIVRDLAEGKPVRRFGVNGFLVDCEGRADTGGAYRCALSREGQEAIGDDFMALYIAQFLQCIAHPDMDLLASGVVGVRNLELQLQVLQHA
ncbi:MAG: Gfo/Idh/MocA family protein [Candidatus Latescibacterota bacterium]|jgi:predicted dehydrogenase